MPDDIIATRLEGYTRTLFAREDEVLEELRYELSRRGLPEINISAAEGRLLQLLLTAVGAREVLEIGTLGGYSAIWMARALPEGGRVVTIEKEADHAAFAREFIERAGLEDVITVEEGDAPSVLSRLAGSAQAAGAEPAFDAVFIDADKTGYRDYLRWSLALVRPGGLILGDNAYLDGRILGDDPDDADAAAMDRFNQALADHPDLIATIIPVRDGLAAALKLR